MGGQCRAPITTAPGDAAVVNYRPIARRLILVVVLGMTLASCGGDDPAASSTSAAVCGTDVVEPLDPRSVQHVLPGATEPTYDSEAPTSGAHELGTNPSGVLTEAVRRPVQVALLEEGGILLQYRDLDTDERRRLEALAATEVVVAPNPDLASALVATAWRHKLSCTTVDVDTLTRFIEAHEGRGADG